MVTGAEDSCRGGVGVVIEIRSRTKIKAGIMFWWSQVRVFTGRCSCRTGTCLNSDSCATKYLSLKSGDSINTYPSKNPDVKRSCFNAVSFARDPMVLCLRTGNKEGPFKKQNLCPFESMVLSKREIKGLLAKLFPTMTNRAAAKMGNNVGGIDRDDDVDALVTHIVTAQAMQFTWLRLDGFTYRKIIKATSWKNYHRFKSHS